MNKDKRKALELLKKKANGEIKITYQEIAKQSGYERKQINRFISELEKRDIDSILVHGLTNKPSNHSAPQQEIDYIKNFKKKYLSISISQFMDIYHEDVIWNPNKKDDVIKYGLKLRSESFFQQLYKKEGWKSPIKHKCFKGDKENHPLRDPMPRRGMLIMTDGTPHDWFNNGIKFSLHMTLDDATGEILSGWFTPSECQPPCTKVQGLFTKLKAYYESKLFPIFSLFHYFKIFIILIFLIFYIFFYNISCNCAYTSTKISACPQMSSPISLSQFFKFHLQSSRCLTF